MGCHKLFLLKILLVLAVAASAVPSFAGSLDCAGCHAAGPGDIRPIDASFRDKTTGGFQGNHRNHMGSTAAPASCATCHNNAAYQSSHRDGRIQLSAKIGNYSGALGRARYLTQRQYVPQNGVIFFNQTSTPSPAGCTNASCHFETLTPPWGTDPASAGFNCSSCHGNPPVGIPPRYDGGAAGSHAQHAQLSIGCAKCHPDHAAEPQPFAHATSIGKRDLTVAPANPGGSFGRYSGSHLRAYLPGQAANHQFGSCSSTYCHSSGAGTAPPYAASAQPPVWGNSGSAVCGSCHKATGTDPIASGSHAVHLTAAAGPQLGTALDACQRCHSYGISTHVNSQVERRPCTPCHKGEEPAWKSGGPVCESCHSMSAGTLSEINGFTAPFKPLSTIRNRGHMQNGTAYQGIGCSSCHDRQAGEHLTGGLHLSDRLINGYLSGSDGSGDNRLCSSCHTAGGSASDKVRPTHPTDPAQAGTGSADMVCARCHDPHGSSNRHMVSAAILFHPLSAPRQVTWSGAPEEMVQTAPPYRGLCQVCHTRTNHYSRGVNNGPVPHYTDNCLGCHSHSSGDYAFRAACDSCHDYPPNTNAHRVHVSVLNYACAECHFGNSHNPSNITTTPARFLTDYNRSLVDVAFNPSGFNSDANNGTVLGLPAFTRNGSSGQATCASLTCHNPDNQFTGKGISSSTNRIPAWGSSITDCIDCHASSYGDYDGGSHNSHYNPGAEGYPVDCVECHSRVNIINPEISGTEARHANKLLDIDQLNDYPVLVNASLPYKTGITAGYTDGPAGTTSGSSCAAVYCHGNGLTSDAGWNKTFTWGNNNNVQNNAYVCWSCHPYGDETFGYTGNQSHAAHVNGVGNYIYEYGPRTGWACEVCHNTPYAQGWHANGRPDLRDSADGTLGGTTACTNCHGTAAGIAEAKANWNLNTASDRHRISSCTSCHNSTTPANSKPDRSGFDAPAKNNFMTTGHGATGTFNATGNSGPAYACTICHDQDSPHFDIYGSTGKYTRLRSVPDSLAYTSSTSELCLDCHKVGQTANGVLGHDASSEASVHAGAIMNRYNTAATGAFPAYGDKDSYGTSPGYQCETCHDSHGTGKLAMIRNSINGNIAGTGNPVAVVGFESTDADFTDLAPDAAPGAGVCGSCHAQSGSSHPDSLHPNNHHQGNTGRSCIECHNHKFSFANVGISSQLADQTVDFGSVASTAASFKTITVTNHGSTAVTIGTMGLPVDYTRPFSQTFTKDFCSGQTLAPTESCSFGIRFSPPATGSYNDSVTIPSSDPAGPATVTLTGTGTVAGPDITVSKAEVRFNEAAVSSTSVETVTISNEGSSNLILGTVASSLPLAAPFSVANDTCSGKVLRPTTPSLYEKCTFDLHFAPTAAGTFTGSFDIPSDDPDEDPVTVSVSGKGVVPVFAYVPNYGGYASTTIAKINTMDKSVTGMSYPVNYNQSKAVAVSSDGTRIYIPAPGDAYTTTGTGANIGVYDPSGFIANITPGPGKYPQSVAISPSGAYLYYTAVKYNSTLGVYEYFLEAARTSNNSVVASKLLNSSTWGYPRISVSPDGSELYLSDTTSTVTAFRTIDLSQTASLSLSKPQGMAFSPDSAKVYVASENSVTVIRTADHAVIGSIPVSGGPVDLAVSSNGEYLYSANSAGSNGSVSVIRTSDQLVVNTIPLSMPDGNNVSSIAITPDGRQLFITVVNTAAGNDMVKVISTATNLVTDTITVGTSPYSHGDFIASRDPSLAAPDIAITDSVSPTDDHGIPFGSLTVNRTAGQTLTLTNNGTAGLVIGDLTAANPALTPFAVADGGDTCSGQTLSPSANCTVQLRFAPTLQGTYYTRFAIPSNDPYGNPAAVTLNGKGLEPEITVTDDLPPVDDLSIPFGNRVMTTTGTRLITVRNSGTGDLVFGGISTSTPFSIDLGASSCDSYLSAPGLPANGTCSIYVKFSPTAPGNFSQSVTITSNDPDEGLVSVGVTGTGTPLGTDITLIDSYSTTSPAMAGIDFGYFEINATQATRYLFARNDGTQDLTMGQAAIPSGPFSINLDGLSNNTLTPNAISNYSELHFNPTSAGTFYAQLSLPTNDPDENPTFLNLTGTGYENMSAFIPTFSRISPFAISYNADGTVYNSSYAAIDLSTSSTNPPGLHASGTFGVAASPGITYVTSVTPNPTVWKNQLLFYQTSDRTLAAKVGVGSNPKGVAAATDGRSVYVANYDDNTVSVVSRNDQAVVATVRTGAGPTGIDLSPDNSHVYATNYRDGTVTVIRTSDNSVAATVTVGSNPNGVAVSPDGAHVYVANFGSNSVSVISTISNTVVDTINVGASPFGVAVTPDGSRVYVSNYSDSSVSVIQTANSSVTKTITGITSPKGISSTPDGRFIYAVSYNSSANSLAYVIQTVDNTVTAALPIGQNGVALGRFITPMRNGTDGDGVPDAQDNCPAISNPLQTDSNGNGIGDACDPGQESIAAKADTSLFEERFSLAVKAGGDVWAWGYNGLCQLGDTSTNQRTAPVPVIEDPTTVPATPLGGVTDVAAGFRFALARKQNGTVWGWGFNSSGQLGLGYTNPFKVCDATQVADPNDASGYLTGVTTVAAGETHSLGLKSDGTVWAWGDNYLGKLGDNSTTRRTVPVQVIQAPLTDPVTYLGNVVAIAAGANHNLALKADGSVWAWGSNYSGALGLGSDTTNKSMAVRVTDPADPTGYLTSVTAIAAGDSFSLAVKVDTTVRSWGANSYGNLGDNSTTPRTVPVAVSGAGGIGQLSGVKTVAAGELTSMALKWDGTVWSWGGNARGELGDNSDPAVKTLSRVPVQVVAADPVAALTGVKGIATGFHGLAVKTDGTIWSWGQNIYGELGLGTADGISHPLATHIALP